MRFTDKATNTVTKVSDTADRVAESAEGIAQDVNRTLNDLNAKVEQASLELTAVAGLAVIAFSLISLVAVSALLIAVKGRK